MTGVQTCALPIYKAMLFLQKALINKNEYKYESMLYNLDQAISLMQDPIKRSSIYLNKSQLLNHLKQYQKALESIEEAIKIYPDHSYIIFKSQILAALHKRVESLATVEQAIAMSNIALYHAMKVAALMINGRMIDGVSHIKWILQHIDDLRASDDFNFLTMMIGYKKSLKIEMAMIEQKLIDILNNSPEPYKTQYIDYCIEHDIFDDLRKSISTSMRNDILSNESLLPIRKLMFLCSMQMWNQAKDFLRTNEAQLASDIYRFYGLIIDLYQNHTIIDLSEKMDSLDEETKHNVVLRLWVNKRYKTIKEYYDKDSPESLIGKWIHFWVCIYSDDYVQAEPLLKQLPFSLNKLLGSYRDNSSYVMDLFGSEINENEITTNIPAIIELIPTDLPYDKLSFELFNHLIMKLFPETYAQLIKDTSNQVKTDYLKDTTKLNLIKLYGAEYKTVAMEVDLIRELSPVFLMSGNTYFASVLQILLGSHEVLTNRMHSIISVSRESERDKILNDLSHNIKNLLRPVIDPLINIQKELPNKKVVFDTAIKGAKLIREIVNAINSSYTLNVDDLIYDIEHPGKEYLSFHMMILDSLKNSISNMFDSTYFEKFKSNYFPNPDAYYLAKKEWEIASQSASINDIIGFVNNRMFSLFIDIYSLQDFKIGNVRSSAVKLMILFQEIIINAVKYASYVDRTERMVEIKLSVQDSNLVFTVSNSFSPDVQAKDTGVGNLIISNYVKILNSESVISKTDSRFTVTIEFNNYWRNHG